MRTTFYNLIASILRRYYTGHCANVVATAAEISIHDPELSDHVGRFVAFNRVVPENQRNVDQDQAALRGQLVNASWVCFESTVDAMYRALADEDEEKAAQERNYRRIKKILRDQGVDADALDRIRKVLTSPHIPIPTKYNYFFKLAYPDDRDVKEDRSFLELFGTVRNTMHNNTISYRTATFETPIGEFSVEEGRAVDFVRPELLLDMVKELMDIFSALCQGTAADVLVGDAYNIQG